jgi:hypothetical protein
MTAEPLQVLPLDGELSVVAARRRARELSEAFAFSQHDQIRIATSVLEVARVVFLATSGGRVEFLLDKATQPQSLLIRTANPRRRHLRWRDARSTWRTRGPTSYGCLFN